MRKFTTKAAAIITSMSLFAYALAPAAFAITDLGISGNGSASTNDVTVNNNQSTTVVQSNDAQITNHIDSQASTGNNRADDNTGGSVTIGTGNASSMVDVATRVNRNEATVAPSSSGSNQTVTVSGNGSFSDNKAKINSNNDVSAFQDNYARIDNKVNSDASTGDNKANRNTGGDVSVITGHAQSSVGILNEANANLLDLGSSSDSRGTTDVTISGNGSASTNRVFVDNNNSTTAVQDNYATIRNYVRSDAESGFNYANDNTGGSVMVDTGRALSSTLVDNMANLNVARIGSSDSSVTAKVKGNGSFSDSYLKANQNNDSYVFQGGDSGNRFNADNQVYASPFSGENYMNRNTGSVYGFDPYLVTGHSASQTRVTNTANANFFGTSGMTMPALDLSFDLGGIFGY